MPPLQKIERLESGLHFCKGAAAGAGKHEVFSDADDAVDRDGGGAAAQLGGALPVTEAPIDSVLTGAAEGGCSKVGMKRSRRQLGSPHSSADVGGSMTEDGAGKAPLSRRQWAARGSAGTGGSSSSGATAAAAQKAAARQYEELSERRERLGKLRKVLASQDVEASLRGKGHRVKVQDATRDAPAVYRWKPVRAR